MRRPSPAFLGGTASSELPCVTHPRALILLLAIIGHEFVRSLWSEFYSGADGIVFLLDAADHDRLAEAREVLLCARYARTGTAYSRLGVAEAAGRRSHLRRTYRRRGQQDRPTGTSPPVPEERYQLS